MKMIAGFRGKNREFRAWLAVGMPENVVSLAGYKHKKSRPRESGKRNKPFDPSIA